MPILYLADNQKFSLSYQELKDSYTTMCESSDEDFIALLPNAIHLACIICYLKEIPSYTCLSDTGIIHELCHLSLGFPTTNLPEVRELFKISLKLA